MLKYVSCVLTFAAFSCGAASAQAVSHPLTAAAAAKITAVGRNEVLSGRTAALAIAVVSDGQVVYSRGFGYANLAKHRAATAFTQFGIGQVSEEFTAAAILLLVQDGKLNLSDSVTKYVPELTAARGVTIAQLLNQTSGLPLYGSLKTLGPPTRAAKFSAFVRAVNAAKADFEPGKKVEYNDLNYILAGEIVERVAGLPLSDFLQARIFQPLYMNASFYASDTDVSHDRAIGYTGYPKHLHPAKTWSSSRLAGAAGLVSTVGDLAKWDIAMPVLLRVDAVRDMFTPSVVGGQQAYGMGFVIDQRDGKRYIWTDGSIAGFRAMNALLPDDNVAVVVLTNADDRSSGATASPEAIAGEVADIVVPPQATHVNNTVVSRAKEWLGRLAARNVDRTQLTPTFSAYLTDALVARANFRAMGKLISIVPTASVSEKGGNVLYEFFVRFRHGQYHYRFGLTPQGKIYELLLTP